ncbi:hypothetical protein V8F06_006751 [Rhypophila decipiens]
MGYFSATPTTPGSVACSSLLLRVALIFCSCPPRLGFCPCRPRLGFYCSSLVFSTCCIHSGSSAYGLGKEVSNNCQWPLTRRQNRPGNDTMEKGAVDLDQLIQVVLDRVGPSTTWVYPP